ncbi:MAG: bifunctional phosphopantothenoylcysteine decarboxylase/phosphopantothenate--cysteine ligase CoaBC, partial [Methanomicrobiales archaeon]|nr:bifunctional phosphopantothenoylcysteine decarboxylase/phosphopantothenate--cysteine ligase CoaBC [Methanomicrobiales archaeon]
MIQTLEGKQVILAVTGSIAAVESVRLAHALRRKGAVVQGVMSPAACGILHPDALTFATGSDVITRCSGHVEHVLWCGEKGRADLLLIAPCTANTLGKVACGIDDTCVTTFATTAIGSGIPVLIAPAMHAAMYRHPAVAKNLETLATWGIGVIPPRIEEGKAKIADIDTIILHAERALLGKPLAGKRVLVTSGSCREAVDDVRILTTRSSGAMGRAIALQAFRLGANVTVVHADTFPCVENAFADNAAQMREQVLAHLSPPVDYYVSAAAISDFAPVRYAGKLESGTPVSIPLQPLPKLLDEVLSRSTATTVAFKLGGQSEEKARRMLAAGSALVVVNDPPVMG